MLTSKEGEEMKNLTFDELIESLTPSKRKLVLSAIELYKRQKSANVQKILSSKDANNVLNPLLTDLKHEEFWVLYMNTSNKIIKSVRISSGAINQTCADIRLILKNGLLYGATGIILGHNHPSGTIRPSEADNTMTGRIAEGAKSIDIKVLDHIIVAGNEYYSYADEGKL